MLKWLQEWYLSKCDGDWEHSNQIKIMSLDNPGWEVEINIEESENIEKLVYKEIKREISNENWIYCKVDEGIFYGAGGPENLIEILEVFKEWMTIK